jgi:long-chain acyl-CoA synthetase
MNAPWTRFYEQGVPATIDYPSWTLPDLLDHSSDAYPDQTALTFFVDPKLPPSRMTYRGLRDATLRFATALYQLGVRKGDRVAILADGTKLPVSRSGYARLKPLL